jgi:hypothetical protein
MEILVPTSAPRNNATSGAKAYDLQGKRVAIVSNGWVSMDTITSKLAERLKEKHGVTEVRLYSVHINKPITPDTLAGITGECDAAIVGIAN